jgi:hypothetical protein
VRPIAGCLHNQLIDLLPRDGFDPAHLASSSVAGHPTLKRVIPHVALRLVELEAEDRAESLENLRACFAALDIGQQGRPIRHTAR